jgi:hypothetical protein
MDSKINKGLSNARIVVSEWLKRISLQYFKASIL